MKRLSVFLIIFSCFLLLGCYENKKEVITNPSTKPTTKVLFLEHKVLISGKLIEGEYNSALIDAPMYQYDSKTRNLQGLMEFKIDEDLLLIIGDETSLSGVAGGGISSQLFGTDYLPFSYSYNDHGFEVTSITPEGNVTLKYLNEEIILEAGEIWEKATTKTETNEWGDRKGTAELTTTVQIINHSYLEKENIRKW